MVETLSNTTGLKITYGFEPDRSLKIQVKNEFGGMLISQYDYQYDEIGRLTLVSNSGTAFSADGAGFIPYAYNDRSELAQSARYLGTDIENLQNPVDHEYRRYRYDPIGTGLRRLKRRLLGATPRIASISMKPLPRPAEFLSTKPLPLMKTAIWYRFLVGKRMLRIPIMQKTDSLR